MMIARGWVACLGLLILSKSPLAESSQRVALVIGNDTYQTSPKLDNARNDARDMASALKDIGFTLSGGQAHLDVSRTDLLRLVREFTGSLSSQDVALFYFAGHAVASSGENWLLPVNDGDIKYQEDVPDYAVSAQSVLQRLEARNGGINLVILDAYRNNKGGRWTSLPGLATSAFRISLDAAGRADFVGFRVASSAR